MVSASNSNGEWEMLPLENDKYCCIRQQSGQVEIRVQIGDFVLYRAKSLVANERDLDESSNANYSLEEITEEADMCVGKVKSLEKSDDGKFSLRLRRNFSKEAKHPNLRWLRFYNLVKKSFKWVLKV